MLSADEFVVGVVFAMGIAAILIGVTLWLLGKDD